VLCVVNLPCLRVFFLSIPEGYDPIGFVHTPAPVTTLQWSTGNKVRIMAGNTDMIILLNRFSCQKLNFPAKNGNFPPGVFLPELAKSVVKASFYYFEAVILHAVQLCLLVCCEDGSMLEVEPPVRGEVNTSKSYHLNTLSYTCRTFSSIKDRLRVGPISLTNSVYVYHQ